MAELVSVLANLGAAGFLLLGGGTVYLVTARRSNNSNGQLRDAFSELMAAHRQREQYIERVLGDIQDQGKTLIGMNSHLEQIVQSQNRMVERMDRLLEYTRGGTR